jgi:hypothetical protein
MSQIPFATNSDCAVTHVVNTARALARLSTGVTFTPSKNARFRVIIQHTSEPFLSELHFLVLLRLLRAVFLVERAAAALPAATARPSSPVLRNTLLAAWLKARRLFAVLAFFVWRGASVDRNGM